MMRLCAVIVSLVVFQGQASDADIASLTRLEAEWNTAHTEGDATTLARIFADDLVVVVPSMRPLTKADSLGMFKMGGMKFDRYESSDAQPRVYGDTAIVSGRIKRTRTINGKTMDDDWRFTKVYLRRAGNWQVVSFHASNAAPQ
jgi:ketosteroid isomerase-like protein